MANQVRFLDNVSVSAFGNTGGTGTTNTGSLLATASAALNVITFTKGDGSTFPVTIDTGSASSAFPFVGNAVITGSLTVSGSNSTINTQELQFDTNHSASGHTTGRIYWDDNNKTFTGDMQGSNVKLQIGQEEHIYAKNNSGVTINNGDAVRISGAQGANVTITKAVSGVQSFKDAIEQDQILGLATEQIADNQSGYVTTFGSVRDLDTSAFSEGDILYLSHLTSGSYTNVRPPAPCFEARVGIVQIANATEGVILVNRLEPTFFSDISQVTSSGVIPNEKTYLVYDDSTDLISFTNEFSGSFSGSFQGDGSNLTGVDAFPFSGSAIITGSLEVSGSGNNILTIQGSGSANPLVTIQGSSGELFTITDSLSGSLFVINNSLGNPIFEVYSDNKILYGDSAAPTLTTTVKNTVSSTGSFTVYSLPTSSYDGAFFKYVAKSGSDARAGEIMSLWSGTAVNFTETTTRDFGNTTALSFNVVITGSNFALTGSATTPDWIIKTIVKSI